MISRAAVVKPRTSTPVPGIAILAIRSRPGWWGCEGKLTRIRAPPTISDSEACGRTWEATSTEWSDARAPQGGFSPHPFLFLCTALFR